MAARMAHLSSFQSVHLAPGVCVEVWVAVRAKALAWVTESASATLATRDSCARAAPTATSGRKAPTTAPAPVQVAADHKSGADFPSVSSQINLSHSSSSSFVSLSPLCRAACYHSCKKCAGPQDYKCLDCKAGWMLHDNKCVGECVVTAQASAVSGQRGRPALCARACVCVLSH